MRPPLGLGVVDETLASDSETHAPLKLDTPILDCDDVVHTSQHVERDRCGPHRDARPSARVPLHRRASLHQFLRGRELCRTTVNTTLRPGVRDFVSGDSESCEFSDDDDEARSFGERRVARGRNTHGAWKRPVSGVIPIAEITGSEDTDVPPFVCRFAQRGGIGANSEKLLAVATEEGDVVIVDINKGLPGSVQGYREREHRNTTGACHTNFTKHNWLAHDNAVFDLQWCSNNERMLTASGDQTVKLWDVATEVCHRTFRFHRGSVKSIAVRPEGSGEVFASCGRDGCVALWDTRVRQNRNENGEQSHAPIAAVERAHEPLNFGGRGCTTHMGCRAHGVSRRSLAARLSDPRATRATTRASQTGGDTRDAIGRGVTSVASAHDGQLILTAGAADGIVKIWDTRRLEKGAPVAQMVDSDPGARAGGVHEVDDWHAPNDFDKKTRRRGVTSLALAPGGSTRVAVSYSDSHVAVFNHNVPSAGPVCHLRGNRAVGNQPSTPGSGFKTSFYVKTSFSPCGAYLASGSCDASLYVWSVDRPLDIPVVLKGHTGEVTAVDWSSDDFDCIASCADDGIARVWSVDRRRARAARRLEAKSTDGYDSRLTRENEIGGDAGPMEVDNDVFRSPTRFRDDSGIPGSNQLGDYQSPANVHTPALAREHSIRSYFSPR